MASLPNPFSFEGAIVGAMAVSSQFPRPGLPPKRSMAASLDRNHLKEGTSHGKPRSMATALGPSPARAQIFDLGWTRTKQEVRSLDLQYNPKEMHETIKVTWNEITVPGLSHKRLHYSNTENVTLKFDLFFDALQVVGTTKYKGIDGAQGILYARNFLQSLCYSNGADDKIPTPPMIQVYWPKLLSLVCVVTDLDFTYTRMAADGSPLQFTCAMGVKEIRHHRLTGRVVASVGSDRNNAPPVQDSLSSVQAG